ncbi:MAG: hypothetical protein WEB00_06080 [Dehalococcoidia bacterium]
MTPTAAEIGAMERAAIAAARTLQVAGDKVAAAARWFSTSQSPEGRAVLQAAIDAAKNAKIAYDRAFAAYRGVAGSQIATARILGGLRAAAAADAAASTGAAVGWGTRIASVGRFIGAALWPPKPIPLIIGGLVVGAVVGGVIYLNSDNKTDDANVAGASLPGSGEFIGPAPENGCYEAIGRDANLVYDDNVGWRSSVFPEPIRAEYPDDATYNEAFQAWQRRVQGEVDAIFTVARRNCDTETTPEETPDDEGAGGDEEQIGDEQQNNCEDEGASRFEPPRSTARAGGPDPCETPEGDRPDSGGPDDGIVSGRFTNAEDLFEGLGDLSINRVSLYFPPEGGRIEGEGTLVWDDFKYGEFFWSIGNAIGEGVEDTLECLPGSSECGSEEEPDEAIPPEYANCFARFALYFTFEGDEVESTERSGTVEVTLSIEDVENCPSDAVGGEGQPQTLSFNALLQEGSGTGVIQTADGGTLNFVFEE